MTGWEEKVGEERKWKGKRRVGCGARCPAGARGPILAKDGPGKCRPTVHHCMLLYVVC